MWWVVLLFTNHACGPCGPSELTLEISLHFPHENYPESDIDWVGNKVEKLWYDFWASVESNSIGICMGHSE